MKSLKTELRYLKRAYGSKAKSRFTIARNVLEYCYYCYDRYSQEDLRGQVKNEFKKLFIAEVSDYRYFKNLNRDNEISDNEISESRIKAQNDRLHSAKAIERYLSWRT